MEKQFAENLMKRPTQSRWVVAPSPRGKRRVSGVILELDGDNAKIMDVTGKVKDYWVQISDLKYR